MDAPSDAAPGAVPPSPRPPPLPQTKRARPLLTAGLIVGLVVAFAVGLGFGSFYFLRALQRRQPGPAVVLHFDLSKVSAESRNDVWQGIVRAVNRRADALGGCWIDEVEPGRIRVRLLGKTAAEIAAAGPYLATTKILDFRLVHRFLRPETTPRDEAPPGYAAMALRQEDDRGPQYAEELFVKEIPELTGSAISDAYVSMDGSGRYKVMLRFTKEGGRNFAEVTRAIAEENGRTGRLGRLAIVLDGKLYSAPVVREEIPSGSAEITGRFTERAAVELANMLDNPLPFSGTFTLENAGGREAGFRAAPSASR